MGYMRPYLKNRIKTRKVLTESILLCSWWFASLRVKNGVNANILSVGAALAGHRAPQKPHPEELITQGPPTH